MSSTTTSTLEVIAKGALQRIAPCQATRAHAVGGRSDRNGLAPLSIGAQCTRSPEISDATSRPDFLTDHQGKSHVNRYP